MCSCSRYLATVRGFDIDATLDERFGERIIGQWLRRVFCIDQRLHRFSDCRIEELCSACCLIASGEKRHISIIPCGVSMNLSATAREMVVACIPKPSAISAIVIVRNFA